MIWRVEIRNRDDVFDAIGDGIRRDILDLNIEGIKEVRTIDVYLIEGRISEQQIRFICEELLCDPVTQEYTYKDSFETDSKDTWVVEVTYKPGVMDPVEESLTKGIRDLGIKGLDAVKTAKRYVIKGKTTQQMIQLISEKLLYNRVIQHLVDPRKEIADMRIQKGRITPYRFRLVEIPILEYDDNQLLKLSREGQLYLNLEEMKAIKKYFKAIKRNPTDCELETIAQTWSEHCKHKTLRGLIEYKEIMPDGRQKRRIINNLLNGTIMKVTRELKKRWCLSVFKDNSGVIEFNRDFGVCFKVETHNHPSAIEPYGGAGTGIGGVIRDSLGTGRAAKPILNTDVFCFAPPHYPYSELPKGILHPKRIMKGVVAGVRDYGNRMGIPTANGAVLFDERYLGNPLVFCGNVGLIPKNRCSKWVDPGDYIVLVGGRTGRDGIHGATFSSGELTAESETISSSAVQIGNPITEKKMTDAILKARDTDLFKAITDCGGGGLSSAVGEMGEQRGVKVYLDRVPLKYKGLSYAEIWISEAQERMILAVEPKKVDRLLKLFNSEDVEATIIGEFTDTRRLELFFNRKKVADLDMQFLHHGLPRIKRQAVYRHSRLKEPSIKEPSELAAILKKILSSYNIASKEWIIRQYDHEVQGGSVLKPLVGPHNDGPSDACIVRPLLNLKKGIIVSNGINPRYGFIDPYWMSASAIDEALRQIIAVGGSLRRVALLDNFCWGNTDKPDRLGSLVRAAFGCYDIALGYGVPFISGKDSLNNEYSTGSQTITIPGTILISALAVIDDVSRSISMELKQPDSYIYIVGLTEDELGGSHYYYINGYIGANVPKVDVRSGKKLMERLSRAASLGLINACHDCSEGGIGVACAEMAFSSDFGMEVDLRKVPCSKDLRRQNRSDKILFSESNSRFIVEVSPKNYSKFQKVMDEVCIGLIGKTTSVPKFKVIGLAGKTVVDEDLSSLKSAWKDTFSKF